MPKINAAFESLDPLFKPIVLEILTELERLGWQPAVIEGRRTPAQQAKKVKDGVSTTMHSYHLTGKAADICDVRYMWNIPQHHQFWLDLGHTVEDLSDKYAGLGWGGVWYKDVDNRWDRLENKKPINWFADVAHVELR